MICERGLNQFGKFSSASALEFFQFNGKKATIVEGQGIGRGKGVRIPIVTTNEEEEEEEEGEILDYEEDDEFELVESARSVTPQPNPTYTPANTPVIAVQERRILTTSNLTDTFNPSKKRKFMESVGHFFDEHEKEIETLKAEKKAWLVEKKALLEASLEKEKYEKEIETLKERNEAEKKALLVAKEECENELKGSENVVDELHDKVDELEKQLEKLNKEKEKLRENINSLFNH